MAFLRRVGDLDKGNDIEDMSQQKQPEGSSERLTESLRSRIRGASALKTPFRIDLWIDPVPNRFAPSNSREDRLSNFTSSGLS